MTTEHCDCFGESGLHASTHNNGRERCCDLCGRPVKPDAVDVLTGLAAMTPTPATAERLARALAQCQAALVMVTEPKSIPATTARQAWATCVAAEQKARAALAAYTAEGGKL